MGREFPEREGKRKWKGIEKKQNSACFLIMRLGSAWTGLSFFCGLELLCFLWGERALLGVFNYGFNEEFFHVQTNNVVSVVIILLVIVGLIPCIRCEMF